MPKLMTLDEVAEYLRLDYKTVHRQVKEGKLPAVQIGRSWRVDSGRLREMIDGETAASVRSDS